MSEMTSELLGRLALHYQLIDEVRLSHAFKQQEKRPDLDFGDVLVQLGFLSEEQLAQLTEAARRHVAAQSKREVGRTLQGAMPAPVQRPPAPPQQDHPSPAPVPRSSPNVPPAAPAATGTQRAHRPEAPPAQTPQNVRAPAQPQPQPQPQPQAAAPQQPAAPQAPARAHAVAQGHPQHDRTRHAPPTSGAIYAVASSPQVKWLHQVLASAAKAGASDVHVHAGSRVRARKYGDLVDITKEVLSAQETEGIIGPSLVDWQKQHLAEHGEVDFAYSIKDVGRFRVNVYKNQSGLCGVYHFIPAAPPELDKLGLPESTPRLINHHNGIVLITGPSGCGKTSTMAALVNLMNEEREDHILSIEDPIEYVHVSKRCVVNQRQVSRHTRSFAAALRSALREDPDVICIGELRDLETISLALSAAETGHLVLGTLHTQGAIRTISRIIGAYPARQQSQIRMMLSESLRAVISQKLLPRADGSGVVLAYELLFMNLAAANLIRENRTFQLGSVLQTGRTSGQRAMDDSLRDLLQKGLISKKTALLNADNPKLLGG